MTQIRAKSVVLQDIERAGTALRLLTVHHLK